MASRWAGRLAALDRWFDSHDEVITARQCDRLGFDVADRRRLVSEGRVTRAHPRVLVRGRRPPGPATSLRVAVVAAGEGAAASHLSAAWWLGLLETAPTRHHLTVPPRRRVRLPAAIVHQATLVGEARSVGGLRVTTPERTVIDLAARSEVTASMLATAVERALSQGLTTDDRLVDIATSCPGRRRHGAPRLRGILEDAGHIGLPGASVLELRAHRLIAELARTHGIELPVVECHQLDGRYRLDIAWPRLKLAVEVDGFTWHRRSADLDHDDERRTDLTLAGWEVIPFTWKHVVREPEVFCEKVLAASRQAEARVLAGR